MSDPQSKSRSSVLTGSLNAKSGAASFTKTTLFLRKQLWIWPLVAAVMLAAIGYSIRRAVEDAVKVTMGSNLQALLNADVSALQMWIGVEESAAVAAAEDHQVHDWSLKLVELAQQENVNTATLLQSTVLAELRNALQPTLDAHHYDGFALVDKRRRIIGAMRDAPVGKDLTSELETYLEPAFAGNPVVTVPTTSPFLLTDEQGESKAGLPVMFAAAPIRSPGGEVMAVLGLRIRPEKDFTRILSVARPGETGEVYAVDKNGLLISLSRFDEDLKEIGLLPDRPDAKSILNLELRDPGVNLKGRERPKQRRSELGLTRAAAAVTAKTEGMDIDGYRDYRGVPSIGAWKWLPESDFGVIAEYDLDEAYRPVYILRYAFWGLFALLVASSVAIFVFSVVVARMQRSMRQAALKVKQLGQYALDEKIGSGGMGVVYRGHHSMLRRPTAIKLLDLEKATDASIARFEREVQLTSQLNHPNTIAVYDYGRTREGVFYYAMEYLDGLTLEALVLGFGPQPEGRVISILQQVCGSLNEAHGVGLIHRDIKPANVILNKRGGMYDVAKVLDFGLVKAVDSAKEASLTAANSLTGTPLYLSPESIERPAEVDARSDLYAVGAVGYFLLTGAPVFDGRTVVEICMHHTKTAPERPSARVRRTISVELEDVILRCLAKSPADRPQTAKQLAEELGRCAAAKTWTSADAEKWWNGNLKAPGAPDTHPTVNAVTDRTQIVDTSATPSSS